MSREPDSQLRILVPNVDHAEGIAWQDSTRSLIYGTEGGQVWSLHVDSGDTQCLATGGGFLLGITVATDQDIYACDMTNACVHRCNPATKTLSQFSPGPGGDPMRIPNFAVFREDNVLYVSDSGSTWDAADGTIWAIAPTGEAARAIDHPLSFPNGMAITPDGNRLMCLETAPPRLLEFAFGAGDRLHLRRVATTLPGTVPDGLAFTSEGTLLIACYRPDCILQLYPPNYDRYEIVVTDPVGRLLAGSSNLCFFDSGLERLAIANVGGIHIAELITDHRGLDTPAQSARKAADG